MKAWTILAIFSLFLVIFCSSVLEQKPAPKRQDYLDFFSGFLGLNSSSIFFKCSESQIDLQNYHLLFEIFSGFSRGSGMFFDPKITGAFHEGLKAFVMTFRNCGSGWFKNKEDSKGKMKKLWNTLYTLTGINPEKNSEYLLSVKTIEEVSASFKKSIENAADKRDHRKLGEELKNLVEEIEKKINKQTGGILEKEKNKEKPKKYSGEAPGIGAGKRLELQRKKNDF